MHSILFVATMDRMSQFWGAFATAVDDLLQQTAGVSRIAENVWLLDLTISTHGLGTLIFQAGKLGIPYGLLPFADAPQWLPAGYNPTPIPVRNG
jgi:hypothetical protein